MVFSDSDFCYFALSFFLSRVFICQIARNNDNSKMVLTAASRHITSAHIRFAVFCETPPIRLPLSYCVQSRTSLVFAAVIYRHRQNDGVQ